MTDDSPIIHVKRSQARAGSRSRMSAYSEFFKVWFGDNWRCVACGQDDWVDKGDYHECANTACGHKESLRAIPQLADAEDMQGRMHFRVLMRVYDEGVRHRHYGSGDYYMQLALIKAGVLYGRVPVPNSPMFNNSDAAREFIEEQLYPRGMQCPECYAYKSRSSLYKGRYQCCGKKFSVYSGTPLHHTRFGAHMWLRALWALKNNTDPKDLRWIGECMYGEDFNYVDAPTVRAVVRRLTDYSDFCDVVGEMFDMQERNPKWVRALMLHRQGDPYEGVLISK